MRLALLVACVALACVGAVSAQAPIPLRNEGWNIGSNITESTPIVMDVFFDLLCPDCAAAWPNVLNVVNYYHENLALYVHAFPLPYHQYGFLAAKAAHVVAQQLQGEGNMAPFLDFVFAKQAAFWNDATAEMTSTQVAAQLGATIVQGGFLPNETAWTAGMANGVLDDATRVSWKYGCSKAVLGTPTFFVNGVFVAGDPSWTLAEWRTILDPLLAVPQAKSVAPAAPAHVHVHHKKPHSSSHSGSAVKLCNPHKQRSQASRLLGHSVCPSGEPVCMYLPGKTECCFPGENCIPNVGCRC